MRDREIDLEYAPVGDLARIVGDLHRFGVARIALRSHFVTRGRLVAAGVAGDSVGHAGDMLEDAPPAPETSARDHRDFGRLAARLLVDGGRRHDARLFGRRSRNEEGGRRQEPDENERRKRGASFEGRDHDPIPYLPIVNHRNALHINRHYGVEATTSFISRTCVITLTRASLLLMHYVQGGALLQDEGLNQR